MPIAHRWERGSKPVIRPSRVFTADISIKK